MESHGGGGGDDSHEHRENDKERIVPKSKPGKKSRDERAQPRSGIAEGQGHVIRIIAGFGDRRNWMAEIIRAGDFVSRFC